MDGPAPVEEDFSGLTIAERLAHKNWKARVNGYEYLAKKFAATADEADEAFRPYMSSPELLKKMATDANVVAQEKGVDAVLAFVKFSGENSARTRETVMPSVVDKCFGSARQATKQKGIALALDYIEVENTGEGVIRDILVGLNAKQPKAVAAAAAALNEAIVAFGVKVVAPGPIFKVLPKLFGHSDKTVRAEANNIVLALYSWIGPALLTSLGELKPVQVKELTEAFEAADKNGKGQGTGHQERYTKSQQREREAAAAAGAVEEVVEEEAEVFDLGSMVEPVDIMPKIPGDFHTKIASSKWKDRKEVLDALFEVAKATPKIIDAEGMGELVKALVGRMPDANINCVMVAASDIGLLAKGIGQPFGRFKTTVVPPMLERLKDRKAAVTDAIGSGLDDFFTTITFPDLTEEFIKFLKHKNPQVKEGTTKFLNRCLTTTKIPPNKPDIKPYAEALVELLADSADSIRTAAAEGLALFIKIFGDRMLNPYLEPLDDLKKGKIKEAGEKVTVKCKAGAPPPPAAPKAAPPSKAGPKSTGPPKRAPPPKIEDIPFDEEEKPPKPLAKPPARLLARKAPAADSDAAESSTPPPPPPKASAPAAAKKPSAAVAAAMAKATKPSAASSSAAASASAPSESFKYKFNPDDADARIADAIPANFAAELGDSAWKVRLQALEEGFPTWLDSAVDEVDAELIFRFLGKKPGWNEKNFQVSSKVYGIMATIAERSPTFGKNCVALVASHLTDKLGDIKLKKPAGDALVIFAEKTSLAFVLSLCYEPITKQKAPKNYAEGISWINVALREFGIAGLTLRPLVEFLKSALGNANAAVRTSATSALVTLKLFAGPSIKDLLEGLSPQLLATISSEFDKVDGEAAPTPIRECADVRVVAAAPGGKAKGGADPLDDLFPRVDLEKIVSGTKIIEEAKSEAWKTRKEALETLQGILQVPANKRLKSNLNEISQMLKPRLTDLNKSVQNSALDCTSRIAAGMNKPFEKYCRTLVPPITQAMADRSNAVRVAATNTIGAIASACEGVDAMASSVATALETQNPVLRATLLGWMDSWVKEHGIPPSTDLSSWAPSLIICLEDKSGEVRKLSQALLPTVINNVGYDRVAKSVDVLKPGSRAGVMPFLATAKATADAMNPTAPSAAAPARAAPPAAAASRAPARAPAPVVEDPEPEPEPLPSAAAPRKGMLARRLIAPSSSRPASRAEGEHPGAPGTPGGKMRPLSMAMKRPVSVASKPMASAAVDSGGACPYVGMDPGPKKSRLVKDPNRWIVEAGVVGGRKDLADILSAQYEGHASRELIGLLFSHDHNAVNDHIAGMNLITDAFKAAAAGEDFGGVNADDLQAILVANLDLPLKYVVLKVHEPQPNLISKCLEVVESTLDFFAAISYILTEVEALCFVPTIIHKLGDARENVRLRVQAIVQKLPRTFSSSRLFGFLLEHGLRSKVAKTRAGALQEMATMFRKKGMAVCDPSRALPTIAAMVGDKDPATRKSALDVIGEAYVLDGELVWEYMGRMDAKLKTQIEERLRRMPSTSKTSSALDAPITPSVSRITSALPRPASPSGSVRKNSIPTLSSPSIGSRLARTASPPPASPLATTPLSPSRTIPNGNGTPAASRLKPLQSRLAPPRARQSPAPVPAPTFESHNEYDEEPQPPSPPIPQSRSRAMTTDSGYEGSLLDHALPDHRGDQREAVTLIISSILSNDPSRSVDALKKVQKILDIAPGEESSSQDFVDLQEHVDGLVHTIINQMVHVWDESEGLSLPENYRLAKHLNQTLNALCDHSVLAESLPVETLTALLEQLTLRLLQTDESKEPRVKDLSRFINLIILRLFGTAKRINVFRALFLLLIQITKPFSAQRTSTDSREARLAELVLKCLWKLARGIPSDLQKGALNPIELFPALESFLQTIPPNEWKARAQARVPSGDMPLRTIKVIVQHVVGAYGEEVYTYLSESFDDPSATIVYPYVYRTLNAPGLAAATAARDRPPSSSSYAPSITPSLSGPTRTNSIRQASQPPIISDTPPASPKRGSSVFDAEAEYTPRRPRSEFSDKDSTRAGLSRPASPRGPPTDEPDPDKVLTEIIQHISSDTSGALHREGITELYQFLKSYPHKKARVDQFFDSTGPAFRKYLARALASRAADDEERKLSVAQTLSRLESGGSPRSPTASSPKRGSNGASMGGNDDPLSRLHDIFHYQGRSSVVLESRRASLSSSLNGGIPGSPPMSKYSSS